MSGLPVSAVIISFNEEKKIGACLKSLTWADEIIVVDAASTDRTREVCKDPSAPWFSKIRVLEKPWAGFREQRNFAIAQAKNDWLLVVDSDEECSPELAAKVRELLSLPGGPERKAYQVKRREFFMGKLIEHGMWNPSYQDRFFHRAGVQYVNEVHEYPKFPAVPGQIHEPLLHNSDLSVEKLIEKMNRYTTIEAQDRFDQGQRTSLFKLVGAFPAHFFKTLFHYGGYKDGLHGVVLALFEGVTRVVRQLKIWQLMMREGRKT
ncbi:MAG: glycosyltransferase family 2 protein [Bdellovibrionota bacterium]